MFIFLVLFLNACGTLQGHKDIVIIDSSPRNIEVFDEENHIINHTPFFYKLTPHRKQSFTFKGTTLSGKTFTQTELLKCNLDWSRSVIPAGLIMLSPPVGTITGGSFLLIDGISGGLFDCSDPLNPIFNNALPLKQPRPKKILILPPYALDEFISNKIMEEWKDTIFQPRKENNDEVLPHSTVKQELEYLGITNEKHITMDKLQKKFLLRLGHEYQFTHVLYLQVNEKEKIYEITPKLYDAFSGKIQKSPYSISLKMPKADHLFKTHIKWLLKAITILPNTFQLGYSTNPEVNITSREFDINSLDNDKDGTLETKRHPDSLPKALTSLSIGVVENPYHFSTWDFSFGLFPTFSSSSWLSELSNDTTSYSIQLFNFNAFFNAGINLHTIFGAMGINLGLGGVWLNGKDSLGKEYDYLDNAYRVNVSYVAFLSENIFFRGDFSKYELKSHKISNHYYRLNSWDEFYFALGYYFPTLRTMVRKILPF